MGLVRRASQDSVAADDGGGIDMSAILRQAVAAEIERQRLERLKDDTEPEADHSDPT